MKALFRTAFSAIALRSTLPEAILRQRASRYVTVAAYHRICELPGDDYPFDPTLISASPAQFAREIDYLKRHLDVLSLAELMEGLKDTKLLPKRPALITFDDGYYDNFETALPILRDAGVPACFFVATGIVGTRDIPWWDQIACCFKFSQSSKFASPFGDPDPPYSTAPEARAMSAQRFLRRLKSCPWSRATAGLAYLREQTRVRPEEYSGRPLFMCWDAVRDLARAGMEIGSHTRTHPILGRVEDHRILRDEIAGSHEDLCQRLGSRPVAFAYPVGSPTAMSDEADAEIARAGFQISFSYEHGFARVRAGRHMRLPRLHLEFGDNFHAFRMGIAGAPSIPARAASTE
jgi:peptidoglycan/xylan/chitin deacetylase (PgdA/CDA1 family)